MRQRLTRPLWPSLPPGRVLAAVFVISLGAAGLGNGASIVAAQAGGSTSPAPEESTETQNDVLRVCADPNNLPFSNRRLEGFENRLAEMMAEELGAELEYTWWAQRRGFLRNTLYDDQCDAVMGIPSSHELVLATRSYYRSSYVFVQRADSQPRIESFDDEALHELTIGVHLIGDDGVNSPPAHALTRRDIIDNVKGYMIYGDYAQDNPPARLVEAVASGEVEVASVWGPLAGYFAPRQEAELVITPVSPIIDIPALPFQYSVSMGVRLNDPELKSRLDEALRRRSEEIGELLARYHIPQM